MMNSKTCIALFTFQPYLFVVVTKLFLVCSSYMLFLVFSSYMLLLVCSHYMLLLVCSHYMLFLVCSRYMLFLVCSRDMLLLYGGHSHQWEWGLRCPDLEDSIWRVSTSSVSSQG